MPMSPKSTTAAEIDDLRRRVAALIWYHTIDLGHGIVTPGIYDHRPYLEHYGFPDDLRGKTVLDVGAAGGFFSFELERRGAAVTATDLPEWTGHDFGPNYVADLTPDEARSYLRDPFLLAKAALGSAVARKEINVYDLSPETVGVFDLVFCGSLLVHLTDPIKALWKMKSVTRESAIIATVIHPAPSAEPLALFVGHSGALAWWFPNRACLERMVQSAGFARTEWISDFRLDYRNGKPGPPHAVIRAWV
jgi:tRNA (mo5U34)-methyltransferase